VRESWVFSVGLDWGEDPRDSLSGKVGLVTES
jgi:hypothetical protein